MIDLVIEPPYVSWKRSGWWDTNSPTVWVSPVRRATELLITGTLFDVVFYLGALTLRLPDGPPRQHAPRRPSQPQHRQQQPRPQGGIQPADRSLLFHRPSSLSFGDAPSMGHRGGNYSQGRKNRPPLGRACPVIPLSRPPGCFR